MENHLWNEDGTPKRPDPEQYDDPEKYAQAPFADLVADTAAKEGYLNYARIKRQAKGLRSPEVGDIAHWWDQDHATCRAAIVMETESFGDGALLRVHIPHESFQDWQCSHDEDKEFSGTWHWPCGEGQ